MRISKFSMLRKCALIGVGIALLLVAGVAGVLFSSLPSRFVTPRIAQAIEARLGPGYIVNIGKSQVDPTTNGLDLKLDEFEIEDPSGAPVLRVPSASIALDGNILMGGQASLRRLKIVQPHLTLRIEDNGEVALAGTEGGPALFRIPGADVPQDAPAEIFGFLSGAMAILQPSGPLASFEVAEIERGNIVIDDQRRGRIDRVEQVDLKVSRQADGNGLVASAASASAENRWSVTATVGGKPGEGRDFDLGFENLALGRLIYEALRGAVPAEIDGRLFGHLYARLDPAGQVPTAEARLDVVGFRAVAPDKPDEAMNVERGRVQLSWNGKDRVLRLGQSDIVANNTRISFGGQARPADDSADQWNYAIGGTEIAVPGADPGLSALRFDRFEVNGNLRREARILTIDNAAVRGRALSVVGQGTFDFSGEKPMGDFAIAGSRSPIAALLRVWPVPIAANSRRWIAENVKSGVVEELNIAVRGELAIGPQHERSTLVDAKFTDGVFTYLNGAPPAIGVTGELTVQDKVMQVRLDEGRVEFGDNKTLGIAGTLFGTDDHRPNPFQGYLAIKLQGPVQAAGALMSVPILDRLAPNTSKLLQGNGKVDGTITLTGPFGRGSDISKLQVGVDAGFAGLSLPKGIGSKDIDNGNLRLLVDRAAVNLRGDLKLAGAPMAVEAQIARDETGKLGSTVVAFSMDPSKIKDFSNETIKMSGPVSARLSLAGPGQFDGAKFEADISSAQVEGPLGIGKAAGQGGRIAFTVKPQNDGFQLGDFSAQGGGIDIKGVVRFDGGGQFNSADFNTFRISSGDDTKLSVDKAGQGFKLSMQGSTFDARPALKQITTGQTDRKGPDLDVDMKLGTVVGNNNEVLSGADFRISRRGNTTRSLYLTGRIGGGSIEGKSQGDDNRVISIRAADSGATLRFLDVYRRMRGGALALDVVPGETSKGRLIVQNFQVIGDQQLASVAHSGRGNAAQANNNGMTFTRMETKFRLGDGKVMVDDCVVYGNELGATLDGQVDYAQNQIGLRGTFLPAYALNNLFGKVPVLGMILGGGSQEGLVGITFEVRGPWTAPVMNMNPLSAVAPGFLRKIFEFRQQNPPNADGTSPEVRSFKPNDPAYR
ncbi:AsmA-like C-terminal region-containing protein [Flaviflagellibacter deserti]